jgi:transposase
MDPFQAISLFLGVQDVFYKDIRIYRKSRHIVFICELRCEEYFCRECGELSGKLHDWQDRDLQLPPLGVFSKVTMKLFVPRSWCEGCHRNTQALVEWIHPKFESVTCGFGEVAGRLMEETTCEATGRLLHANSRKLWGIDQYRMQVMLERLRLPRALDVSFLSADEVHFRTKRFGKNRSLAQSRWEPLFITNLVSYKDAKVLFNAPGRGAEALDACFSVLSPGQKLAVEMMAVDMHDPFIKSAHNNLPNAEICVDRFHVAQAVNRTFDEVRKTELKRAHANKDFFEQGMLAPSRKFILMERKKDLNKHEIKWLKKLRFFNSRIHNGMLLVESFHMMLDLKTVPKFRKAMVDWLLLVRESKLQPFRKLAKLLRRYRPNIEAYIKSRLTTAVSEGLNNKIKILKRVGCGYSNQRSFQNKILQRCGYLNHRFINSEDFFYRMPNPN